MNKLIDNNGKLFGKINLLDFIVLLILVIALIGGCYKVFFVDNSVYTPEYQRGQITLRLSSMPKERVQAIKVGDLIRVPKIQDLGEIKDINVVNRIDNVNSVDGAIYAVENPMQYEVTVVIETDELYFRDDFYYIGDNYKINKGMALDVSNGLLACKATMLSIDVME